MSDQTHDEFAVEVEAADSVASKRIAELEKIELQWLTYRNEIGKVEDLEKEVARLSDHIRSIAEHNQRQLIACSSSAYMVELHAERRNFALSILEGK